MSIFFRDGYYWLDLLIGFGSPLVIFFLRRRGEAGWRDWRLFWVGAALGLAWEVPVFVLSVHSAAPVIVWVRPLPAPYPIFLVGHTLWDGALFVAGISLVGAICPAPILARFRWRELAVLLAWGQVSSFAVEISSVLNGGWEYVTGYWWNPILFQVGERPITLLPQIPWLLAPIPFYFAALKIERSSHAFKLEKAAPNV